jgi:hypothetical protein
VFYLGGAQSPTPGDLLSGYLNILFTVLAIVLAQMYWFRWNGVSLGLILLALSCVASLDRVLGGVAYLIAISLAAAICMGLLLKPVASDYRKPLKLPLMGRDQQGIPFTIISDRLLGWLTIQLQALAEKPMGTILFLLFSLLAVSFGLALVFIGQKVEMAANVALVTVCFASLFMSKLFYSLHAYHTFSGVYLRTLPLPPHFWLIRDWVLLGVFTSAVVLPMQLMLLFYTESGGVPIVLTLVVVWCLLLVYRVVIEWLMQQAVLLSSLATGLFIYLFGVVFL